MSKKRYLLNFSGPNFLARLATLFAQLRANEVATVDFQYQAHVGFGSGLLVLEAPETKNDWIVEHARSLDWNSSFISSNLPDFCRLQNVSSLSAVNFFLLDDEWEQVITDLKNAYGGVIESSQNDEPIVLRLNTGQIWNFTCARDIDTAKAKLLDRNGAKSNILLLDINLNLELGTSFDGIKFFNTLRDYNRLLPTIIITLGPRDPGSGGLWSDEVIQKCWEAGAWFFLSKLNLCPRLSEIIDLLVDRRTEPLVITVTSKDLSTDLAYLFEFLRNRAVKVVRSSSVSNFHRWSSTDEESERRLVIECAKHESISTKSLSDSFYEYVEGFSAAGSKPKASIHEDIHEMATKFVRFHHGKIYEVMRLG